ncbi:MAG: hypothetical protein RR458_01925 [Clostridia bacterium]
MNKKIIKTLIATTLAVAMVLSMASCKPATKLPKELDKIIDGIYSHTEKTIERQKTTDEVLDKENCEHWTGFSEDEFNKRFEKGLKRQYVVTAISQAIVVLEVKDGQDVKKIFDEMSETATLNKFGCLPAPQGKILASGNYITIIYGFAESSDFDYSCGELVTAFEKLAETVDYSFDITKKR